MNKQAAFAQPSQEIWGEHVSVNNGGHHTSPEQLHPLRSPKKRVPEHESDLELNVSAHLSKAPVLRIPKTLKWPQKLMVS